MEVDNLSLLDPYCVDSSTFLNFWNRDYGWPPMLYGLVWKHFEGLVNQGKIISTIEVYDELKGDDRKVVRDWATQYRSIFLPYSQSQLDAAKIILGKYPGLIYGKQDQADPYIVALAKSAGYRVLTSEKKQTPASPTSPHIPNLCDEFGVKWVDLNGFCVREGMDLRASFQTAQPKFARNATHS